MRQARVCCLLAGRRSSARSTDGRQRSTERLAVHGMGHARSDSCEPRRTAGAIQSNPPAYRGCRKNEFDRNRAWSIANLCELARL